MVCRPVHCGRFVGRHTELALLAERHRAARQGSGSFILVAAEAGLGKTRLVEEFCARLRTSGERWAVGQALAYAQAPLAPVSALLRGLSSTPGAPALEGALRAVLAPLSSQARIPESSLDRPRLFEAILRALRDATACGPLALVFEDLHWADEGTLAFLRYLAAAVGEERLLTVATYRSECVHAQRPLASTLATLARGPVTWRIDLRPFSDAEMREFTRFALAQGPALGPRVLDEIYRLAEGNPLFAEELLKSAIENAGLAIARELPLTISQAIRERLEYFRPAERSVLACAAVIGRRFHAGLLASVLNVTPERIHRFAKRAIERQLLLELPGDEVSYAFRHATIREVVYQTLLQGERRSLHLQIAREIERSAPTPDRITELAYHYFEGGDRSKAFDYNVAAAEAAAHLNAGADAARFYERALASSQDGRTERYDLYAKLGDAYHSAGLLPEAEQAYETAIAGYVHEGNAEHAAHACLAAENLAWNAGRTDKARATVARMLDILHATPQSAYRFAALVQMAFLEEMAGEPEAALRWLETADAFEGERRIRDVMCAHAFRAGAHAVLGDPHAVFAEYCVAADVARRCGHVTELVRCLGNAGEHLTAVGMREAALNMFAEAANVGRKERLRGYFFAVTLLQYAQSAHAFGLLELARSLIRESLVLGGDGSITVRALAACVGIPVALCLNDEALLLQCDLPDTLQTVFLERHPALASTACAYVEILICRGRRSEAANLLHRTLAVLDSPQTRMDAGWLCVQAARYAQLTDAVQAREWLDPWLERFPKRRDIQAFACLADALLHHRQGAGRQARSCARRAAELFAALDWPLRRAAALESAGDRRTALAVWRACGSDRDVRRLENVLSAANHRRRPATALTPREQEVAGLVAQGHSNRAIAQALFIGERTVETHVASILHKLGAERRSDIRLVGERT